LVSGLRLGPWMDEVYKEHSVCSDAKWVSDSWQTIVQVSWTEHGVTTVRLWMAYGRGFKSREEAEREALASARKWIDEGKPESNLPASATH
jgi:hypothetical protein